MSIPGYGVGIIPGWPGFTFVVSVSEGCCTAQDEDANLCRGEMGYYCLPDYIVQLKVAYILTSHRCSSLALLKYFSFVFFFLLLP
jgi:hypothetical protein